MFQHVRAAIASLRTAVASVETEPLSGKQAADLLQLANEAERVAAAIRTHAARRVQDSKIWQQEGHRTAAHWIAAKTGTSVGHAIGVLDTARQLHELPSTRQAFSSGRISETQAREVASAAWVNPRRERALLETASRGTVKTLQEECRRVRAAAVSDELERYEKIRLSRRLRHWNDPDGAVRIDARLTPDAGALLISVIEARQASIFAEAQRAGRRESSEAYAADALVELAADAGDSRGSPRAMVHVRVDHDVLTAGAVKGDSMCEIPGIGPIPAATARALAEDAILKVIVTKGADVRAVAHAGRTIPSRLRTALEARDPNCVVSGCDTSKNLEIDHYRVAFADSGPTQLDNLARICRWHHYAKTHLGFRLSGQPGAWIWETPADLEGATARPPPDP